MEGMVRYHPKMSLHRFTRAHGCVDASVIAKEHDACSQQPWPFSICCLSRTGYTWEEAVLYLYCLFGKFELNREHCKRGLPSLFIQARWRKRKRGRRCRRHEHPSSPLPEKKVGFKDFHLHGPLMTAPAALRTSRCHKCKAHVRAQKKLGKTDASYLNPTAS